MTTSPTDNSNSTPTLSDADKRAIEKHAEWCQRLEDAAPMQDIMHDHRGTGAGMAATTLAKVWGCSEREAFETATRLALTGHFRFRLHQLSYAFEFSAETFNERERSIAKRFAELPAMLAELKTADESKPFRWQDTSNRSDAVAFLVAFGRLVSRNFELYPAPRAV
jgi:hypothetical protein